MPAVDLLDRLPALHFEVEAELHYFAAPTIKDSSELSASDWLQLSQQIVQLSDRFQHFVVIHGTDTLSYAGAVLHHLFDRDLHIVITGSQYPLFNAEATALNPDSDAWHNLNFALQQTQQQQAGVYVAFDQQLLAAASCYKLHTRALGAFIGNDRQSEHSPSLYYRAQLSADDMQSAAQLRLLNLYISPCSSEALCAHLKQISSQPPHILILQAFGSGNLPYSPALAAQLEQLSAQGCWVILSSQVLYGRLSQQYATGSWLSATGVVFDPHYSQADTYARAILLYLQYGKTHNWQRYWQV